MNLKKKLTILLILLANFLYSQNTIGLPTVLNYSKFEYKGGLQSWNIQQDKNGILYFANNEGVLSFDGVYWKIYPLPNKTIVRSIFIDETMKIYTGGQDELGYFEVSKKGGLQYISLIPFIPESDRKFGDVWDILGYNNKIIVRTSRNIFFINQTVVTSIKALSEWKFLGKLHNQLIAQDAKNGLFYIEENKPLQPEHAIYLPFDDDVSAIIESKTKLPVMTTIKNGLFQFTSNQTVKAIPKLSFLKTERIYKATLVDQETMAIATNNNGIYIIDFEGNEKQHFSKKEGLQNNNVLSVFTDSQKNLWLGLDNGIDFIAYNSAIKQIDPNLLNKSAYTCILKDSILYIGTSNGLYSISLENKEDISFSKGSFSILPNSNGQVWSLTEINNQILMGHHEGAFIVKKNEVQKIQNTAGFWNFSSYKINQSKQNIICGTYKGISFLEKLTTSIQSKDSIQHFDESSRYITIDNENNIWVSHPYHGVFKLSENGNNFLINSYSQKNGLPSTLNNHVFQLKNELVVATTKGIYTYNKTNNVFQPSIYYQTLLGSISIRYLKEDMEGNIWFVSDKKMGVVNMEKEEKKIQYFPELNDRLLSGFEFIYPFNKKNIFIAGSKGLYNINYEKYKNTNSTLSVLIRNVTIVQKFDSTIFDGYATTGKYLENIPQINFGWKLIRFQYASPSYGNQVNVEYSYRLKGYDKNWSEWTNRTEKEYTNLPAGNYTFEVKVRNNLGNESKVANYTFEILPPWYLSFTAKLIYFLLFVFTIFSIVRWQKRKFIQQRKKYNEEQKRLLYILDLERNKKESEIIALQNEKLASELNFQNSELATSAMHLVKKGELINKLKEDLSQVTKVIENSKVNAEIKKITKKLTEDENMDKEWDHFSKHFDKVHSDFLKTLKEKHPAITPNELKLSAYLRMNLTSKEIAQLMNISIRGVEISRYRLRKKLAIPTETSLFDYLITIQSNTPS